MSSIFDALIDAEADLVPAVEACRLAERLRADDPELLTGWLDACAEPLISDALRARNRQNRQHMSAIRGRTQFARDMEKGAFSAYRLRLLIEDGSQRRLGDMTADDCRWSAKDYRSRAGQMASRATFFDRLAEMLDTKQAFTVAAAIDDAALGELWMSGE